MKRFPEVLALVCLLSMPAYAGTLTCNAACLTKAASITTIGVNTLEIKSHVARIKTIGRKVLHPKRKETK